MSYADDEMIAEEDGLVRQFCYPPPRSHAELAQLEAAVRSAENAPTLPALPDFSLPVSRRFDPSRDIPVALAEAKAAFNFEWGTIRTGDPIVAAALAAAEKVDHLHREYPGFNYRCDPCLSRGDVTRFDWAGALFVHFLTCPHFRASVEE